MALQQIIFFILFSTTAIKGEYLNDTDYYYSMESNNNNETTPIMDMDEDLNQSSSKVTHVDSKTLSGSIELTTLQVLTTNQPLEEEEEEINVDLKQSEGTTVEPLTSTTESSTDTITIKSKQNLTAENRENLLEPGLLSNLDETTKVPTDGTESNSSSSNTNTTELMDDAVNGTSGATYSSPSASSTTEKLIIVTPFMYEFSTDATTTEKVELIFSENEYGNTTPYFNNEDVQDFEKVFGASVESDEFNEMVKSEVTVAEEIPATAVSDFKNDHYLQEFSNSKGGEDVIESTTRVGIETASSAMEFLDKTPNGTDDEIQTENSFFMFSTTTSINQEDGVEEKIKSQALTTDESDNFTTTTAKNLPGADEEIEESAEKIAEAEEEMTEATFSTLTTTTTDKDLPEADEEIVENNDKIAEAEEKMTEETLSTLTTTTDKNLPEADEEIVESTEKIAEAEEKVTEETLSTLTTTTAKNLLEADEEIVGNTENYAETEEAKMTEVTLSTLAPTTAKNLPEGDKEIVKNTEKIAEAEEVKMTEETISTLTTTTAKNLPEADEEIVKTAENIAESEEAKMTEATFSTTEGNKESLNTEKIITVTEAVSRAEEVTSEITESSIIEIRTESSLSTTEEIKESPNTEDTIITSTEAVEHSTLLLDFSATESVLKEVTESVTENKIIVEKTESTSLPPGFTTTEISTTINDESHEFQKTAINRTNEGNKFDFYTTDKPTTDITSIHDGDKTASSTFQENNNKEESLSTINIQISDEITSTPALPINNNKNELNDKESLPISTEKTISVTRASGVIQSTIIIDETTSRPFLIEITKSIGVDDNNKSPTSVPVRNDITQEITSTVIPFFNEEDITNTPEFSTTPIFFTQTEDKENFISNSNSTSFENEGSMTSQTIALTTPSSTFALEILTNNNATTLPPLDSVTLPIAGSRKNDKRNDADREEKVFEIITANPEQDKELLVETITNSHFFNEEDNAIKEPKTTTEDLNEKWITETMSHVTSQPFNSFGDIITEINVVEVVNGKKVVTKYNQRENVKEKSQSDSATSLPVGLSLIKENLTSDRDPNNVEDVISFMKLELSKDENNKTVKSEVDETVESSSVLLNKWNDSVREELVAVVLEEVENSGEKIDKGGEIIQEPLGDQTSPLYGLTLTSTSSPSAVEVKSNGEFPRTSTEIASKEQIIINEIEQEEQIVENESQHENNFSSDATIVPISFLEETSSITSEVLTVVEEEGRKINDEEDSKNLVNLLVGVVESVIEQTSEETTTKEPEEITYFVEKVAEEVIRENETILEETATIAISDNKDEHEINVDNSLEPSTVKNFIAEEIIDETSKDNEIKESNSLSSGKNEISLVESFAKNSSDVEENKIEFFTQVVEDFKVPTTTLESLLSTSSHSYENESNSTIAIVNETVEINEIIEKEPEISGKINAKNVSFTAKIIHKDSRFFIPSDAFLSTNTQNLLNITWRSSNEDLNNSLSFDCRYFQHFVQLNIVKGDEMHTHRTIFMSESHKINPLIVFNDELQVHFSSFEFLQGLDKDMKTPDALPSSNQTRSLTAEIMGACIGFSVIIGILLYYSIKAYKGKTREFKPNSTSP